MDRVVSFEKIENCRELGGLVTREGRRVRRGMLLRSAALHSATAEDLRRLTEEWRVGLVLDFRTELERTQRPDVAVNGAVYFWDPIVDEATAGITREDGSTSAFVMPDMAALYRTIVEREGCRRALRRALHGIFTFDYEQGSVLWHCTAGKDRCGIVSALILGVLGVDRETVMKDYLLTNATCRAQAEAIYARALAAGQPESVAATAREVFLAKPEYLDAALDAVEDFGGVRAYVRDALQLDDALTESFRKQALD